MITADDMRGLFAELEEGSYTVMFAVFDPMTGSWPVCVTRLATDTMSALMNGIKRVKPHSPTQLYIFGSNGWRYARLDFHFDSVDGEVISDVAGDELMATIDRHLPNLKMLRGSKAPQSADFKPH